MYEYYNIYNSIYKLNQPLTFSSQLHLPPYFIQPKVNPQIYFQIPTIYIGCCLIADQRKKNKV